MYKINNYFFAYSYIFYYICTQMGKPVKDIVEKKRYAYLVVENLRNLRRIYKDGIVVLTLSVGCYYYICIFQVFSGPSTKVWA